MVQIIYPNCFCCTTNNTCSACVNKGLPYRWNLSVTGTTNLGCFDCNVNNGNFTLTRFCPCTWWGFSYGFCGINVAWILQFNVADSKWYLGIATGLSQYGQCLYNLGYNAIYSKTAIDFKCCDLNVFNLIGGDGTCNFPATITLTPIDSCTPVITECSPSSLPPTLKATILNVAGCPQCDNNTFILNHTVSPPNHVWLNDLTPACNLNPGDGNIVNIDFYCDSADLQWKLQMQCNANFPMVPNPAIVSPGFSFNPVFFEFDNLDFGGTGCCPVGHNFVKVIITDVI